MVDNETEKDICENIRQISLSITVLAMSHRQAWIDIADRVLLLSGAEETPSVAGAATES